MSGAGNGNRTRFSTMARSCSTTKLYPQVIYNQKGLGESLSFVNLFGTFVVGLTKELRINKLII